MIPTLRLDLIQTLAVACVVYYLGMFLRRRVALLERLNIPSAVVGGLLFAALNLAAHGRLVNLQFETVAQPLLIVTFFTTIGMSASLPLLKKGGAQVAIFLGLSTVFCFVQNFVGMGISSAFGVKPLLGVIAGSVTLVGGPATGMAFAPLFEKAGVLGAGTLAITAATFGITCGGIIGGPVGTWLIRRHKLKADRRISKAELREELDYDPEILSVDVGREDSNLVMSIIVAAVTMGLGSVVSYGIQSLGVTLPAYIGAMFVASIFRNVDDVTKIFKIDHKAMELIGGIALNIFLVVALMDLKLWELAHLAAPLAVILAAQVIVVTAFSLTVSFWMMGRDYESAVMAGGFIGFVLGTTANSMANMKALVEKFGPAPRAFLVVPMVGAFFIDFVNALIITLFLNWKG